MKIPRYWAMETAEAMDHHGDTVARACWRWSDISLEDARWQAKSRAGEILQRRLAGEKLNSYFYGERPLREEIIETIGGRYQKELAVITRNAYGALVLNAENALFMDRDFDLNESPGLGSIIKSLFGGKKDFQELKALKEVEKWAGRHPELGVRVYRTQAGLRLLVTNKLFDPKEDEADDLMDELACDDLYMRLCQAQECFRARLTPKPWRIPIDCPPARWPFQSPHAERTFRDWEREYERASRDYAACRMIARFGSSTVLPEIQPIIDYHDKVCRASQNMPLA